eukprot:scaffold4747_cov99-Isochrysis_galbana.AAC.6
MVQRSAISYSQLLTNGKGMRLIFFKYGFAHRTAITSHIAQPIAVSLPLPVLRKHRLEARRRPQPASLCLCSMQVAGMQGACTGSHDSHVRTCASSTS